jgi:hypothetical protein
MTMALTSIICLLGGARKAEASIFFDFPDNYSMISNLADKAGEFKGVNLSEYNVLQGGCTDGKGYAYYAIQRQSGGEITSNRLVKIRMSDWSIVDVSEDDVNSNNPYHHANDLTYNSEMDRLIITHTDVGYKNVISVIKTDLTWEKDIVIQSNICSIRYNAKQNAYVVGLCYNGYYRFAILNSFFDLVAGPDPSVPGGPFYIDPENYTDYKINCQGVDCDDNYIYFIQSEKRLKASSLNYIVVFDWDGNYVESIKIDLANSDKRFNKFEGENIFHVGKNFYIAYNCFKTKDGSHTQVVYHTIIQPITYTVKYDANNGIGTMKPTIINYSTSKALSKNKFKNYRYAFGGWCAFRISDSKWLYTNKYGNSEWYTSGMQPEGYYIKILVDGAMISKASTLDGDSIIMYANWVPFSYSSFYEANNEME